MRQSRTLALGLAAAFLIAGCGSSPNGPSAAENSALSAIPGATKVLSYPISTAGVLSDFPEEGSVGAPAYLFTVQRTGTKVPVWVLGGPSGAKTLQIYPDLAAAAAHASQLHVQASALAIVGKSPLGRVKLQVVGAHLGRIAGSRLRKLGLKLPGSSYQDLAVVTLPPQANAAHLGVAHFVLAQGKVVGEYGGNR